MQESKPTVHTYTEGNGGREEEGGDDGHQSDEEPTRDAVLQKKEALRLSHLPLDLLKYGVVCCFLSL